MKNFILGLFIIQARKQHSTSKCNRRVFFCNSFKYGIEEVIEWLFELSINGGCFGVSRFGFIAVRLTSAYRTSVDVAEGGRRLVALVMPPTVTRNSTKRQLMLRIAIFKLWGSHTVSCMAVHHYTFMLTMSCLYTTLDGRQIMHHD